jgi:mono/diheme cytochrome c family protein
MTASPELLAKGKAIYGQTCATCHGNTGHGDGAGGKGLNPPPRNFTLANGWKNGYRLEEIFGTLERGVPGSAMVSYSYLRKQDRMALAHFIQQLGTFDHGQSDPKARALLEQRFTSQGEVIPNRIPVRDAIQHLVAEYRPHDAINTCRDVPNVENAIAVPERAARSRPPVETRETAEYAKLITAGVPDNGFAVEVSTFTYNQWNQLRLCLEPR